MNHYYFNYRYYDDMYCGEHTYFFECESDEEARAQARGFINHRMRYLNLFTCEREGEKSDYDDLCLYHAYYDRKLCESEYTREKAQAFNERWKRENSRYCRM